MFLLQTIDHERWNHSFSFFFLSLSLSLLHSLTYANIQTIKTHANRTLYIQNSCAYTHTSCTILTCSFFSCTCFHFVRSFVISSYGIHGGAVYLFVCLMDWDAYVIFFTLRKFQMLLAFTLVSVSWAHSLRVHFDFVMNAILTVFEHFIVEILFVKFHIRITIYIIISRVAFSFSFAVCVT